MPEPISRRAALLCRWAALLLPAGAHAATENDQPGSAATIIVSASPLGGGDQPVADSRTIAASRATSIAEQLARTAPGVTMNEIQGNPLQPDIAYHGFTASPLLGTPQGLSVYLDGVRINQPFGDVVDWDLVPTSAIRSIALAGGAAPQFGRNSLGGALVVETRDGRSDPGVTAEASLGSFGRITASATAGGHSDNGLNWFVTGDHFRETGWRQDSPSRATRAFARLGWADRRTDLALSGLFAQTRLNGNGLQEMRLLAADRSSVYTAPDETRNRAWLVNLSGRHQLSDNLRLHGTLFWRNTRTATLNGDINDHALGEELTQPTVPEQSALAAAGYTGFPVAGASQANTPFPRWRCIANVLLGDAPDQTCNGLVNRSLTTQDEWGGTVELASHHSLAGIVQDLTLGLAYASSHAHFMQGTQYGYLQPDRTVIGVEGPGAFADGTQAASGAVDARVDLLARTTSLGLYVLESAHLTSRLDLDLSGRFDRTTIHNRDRITPGGGSGSLDSDPAYARVNPSVALAWKSPDGVTVGLSWAQASRAPSAIELGCSDPASPCRLPNALAGDPPLRQVIARTVTASAGLRRGRWALGLSAFRTLSSDDILFVTDDPSGFGYFRNFGKTRRQGFEVTASASLRAWTLAASYTFVDATYGSPEVVGGSGNSASDASAPGFDGSITIAPGDRIPLIPRHLFKAALGWSPRHWLSFDLDMVAASGVYARGNEDNRHSPDGSYYLGPGRTDGYAVVNLGGEIRPRAGFILFVTLRNLFERHYATAAQLGATGFDATGRFVARPFNGPFVDGELPHRSSTFYAPGAPRSVQAGVRLRF